MRLAWTAGLFAVLASPLLGQETDPAARDALGEALVAAVRDADALHAFAIGPSPSREAAHLAGHPVLRYVPLALDSGHGPRVKEALLDGASYAATPAECFLPDRAIRIRSRSGAATLLVSPECRAMRWVEGDRLVPFAPGGPLGKALEGALAVPEASSELPQGDPESLLQDLMRRYRLLESVARERDEAATARLASLEAALRVLREKEVEASRAGQESSTDARKLAEQFEELNRLFAALEETHEQLRAELDRKGERVASVEKALEEERAARRRLEASADESARRIHSAQAESDGLRAESLRLEAELDRYRAKFGSLEGGEETPREVPPIDGSITAADLDAGLATIDRGRFHGVVKGMTFTVFREDGFVGVVVVEEVFPELSTARIDRKLTTEPIRKGDSVTTRIR